MKMLFVMSLGLALTMGNATIAQAAADPSQYEILGVKLYTPKSQVIETLRAAGYKQSNVEGRNCKDTYEAFVARKVAAKSVRINSPELLCNTYFSNGSSQVEAHFYLGQRGHILSSLRYTFRTTESSQSIYERLIAKLGKADRGYNTGLGGTKWSGSPGSISGPSFSLEGLGEDKALSMTGGQIIADTFREEATKELVRRADRTSAPL